MVTLYNLISQDAQSMFKVYICDIIKEIFGMRQETASLLDLFGRLFNFIKTKLNDDKDYHDALTHGLIYNYTTGDSLLPILEKAFADDNAKQELGKIYGMYVSKSLNNGISQLAQTFKKFIINTAMSSIKEAKQNNTKKKFIQSIINLHHTALMIVKQQFDEEVVFHKSLKEAFEDFINREYFTSAVLAKFANQVLLKGPRCPKIY